MLILHSINFWAALALPLLLAFIFAGALSSINNKYLGLARAWLRIFGFAGLCAALVKLYPSAAVAVSWAALVLLAALSTWQGFKFRAFRLLDLAWILPLLWLLLRSVFPQFDIDSQLYHLNTIRYLQLRPQLTLYQQHSEVASVWNDWLGLEESLLVPLLQNDLALAGGILGGALKCFAVLTAVLLLPARALALRSLSVFLFLIDDHFFFSGQSRFVYLNPSILGTLSLAVLLSWKARKNPRYCLPALLLLVAAVATKTHAAFFLAALLPFLLWGIRGNLARMPALARDAAPEILFCAIGIFAFFFLRWLERGSPLAPFNLPLFETNRLWRDTLQIDALQAKRSLAHIWPQLWRPLVYPGNLAMKACSVLLLPALALQACRRSRLGALSCLFLSSSALWAFLSSILNQEDSRYPRYGAGCAILGAAFLACSLWQRLPRVYKRPLRPLLSPGALALSLALALWIFTGIDTRYYNVPSGERPQWSHILSYWKYYDSSLDPRSRHMNGLLMPFFYSEVAPLRGCMEALSATHPDLANGKGVLLYATFSTWPLLQLSPGAVAASPWEGGGFLRGIDDASFFAAKEIRYFLVPKDRTIRVFDSQARERQLRLEGTVLCESPKMQLLWKAGV